MQPQSYSQSVGLSDRSQTYKIIGIYRQSNLWDTADYRFLPNTVFVPNSSLSQPCYADRSGALFTYVLQNGRISDLQDALVSQGYPPNILFCFDNGYCEMEDTLHGFYSSAAQLFLVACLTNSAALLVFLALFVSRQRRDAGRMLSLGQGKMQTTWFLWRMWQIPILLSVGGGTMAGVALMQSTMQTLLKSTSDLLDTNLCSISVSGYASQMLEGTMAQTSVVVPTALLQAAVYSAPVFLVIPRMVKKSPLNLLRTK